MDFLKKKKKKNQEMFDKKLITPYFYNRISNSFLFVVDNKRIKHQ